MANVERRAVRKVAGLADQKIAKIIDDLRAAAWDLSAIWPVRQFASGTVSPKALAADIGLSRITDQRSKPTAQTKNREVTMGKITALLGALACVIPLHAVMAQAPDKWDSLPWIEGKPVTLKAGYNTIKQYPHGRAIERFVNRVAERTGENVQIQTFPSEQAGNERQMLESIVLGNLDIAKVTTGVISTMVPEFGIFDLPYVFRDLKHMMAAVNGKVGQDLSAKLEGRGVKVLMWMEQGTRSFYTVNKPIKTPADLKGLKIRTIQAPVMVDSINTLGATATPMGFGELYLGLRSGVVDGAENAPDAIWYNKHHEVAKYLSLTNHFRTPVVLVMSKAKFDALPPEYKEIVMVTARETQDWAGSLYSQVSEALMDSLKKAGMNIVEVDEAAFRKAVEPVYAKHAARFSALLPTIRDLQ